MDPSQMSQIKKMMDIVSTSSNPTKMLEMMASTNPALKEIMSAIQTSRMTPKDAFYKKAHDMGMNDEQIETFLAQIRGSA